MRNTRTIDRAVSIATTRAVHLQSSDNSGRLFGVAAAAVFLVMMILNALSY